MHVWLLLVYTGWGRGPDLQSYISMLTFELAFNMILYRHLGKNYVPDFNYNSIDIPDFDEFIPFKTLSI